VQRGLAAPRHAVEPRTFSPRTRCPGSGCDESNDRFADMKFRTFVPLLTYPDASTEATVRNAAAAARLIGDELHALALEADIPQVKSALSSALTKLPKMIQSAERMSAQNRETLLAQAHAEAEAQGLDLTTSVAKVQPAMLGEVAAGHARYFDMVLLGWTRGHPGVRMVAEALLLGSGRPIMLVPDEMPVQRFGRVSIAWDGSRVAARAVSDARVLLERADEVSVITVTDEKPLKEEAAGERLAENLRKSGLKAQFSAVRAEDGPIAETLQRHAVELGTNLLVMGGYGHSRLRDFVLGGATEGVFSDLRLPVLLSH